MEIGEERLEGREAEDRLLEYERVVDGLEEMIVVVDRDYRYVIANRAFLQYRGLTKEQLVGQLVPDLLNPGVFEKEVKPRLDECLAGNIVRYELRYRYPTLGERDLLISYSPISCSNGIDRVACVLQDVTERKQAETARQQLIRDLSERTAALRESEERLRMTLDAAQVGTFEFWPETGKLLWDDQNKRIWGLRPEEEWTYSDAIQRLHPDDRERIEGVVRGALDPASDGSYDCDYRILLPNGSVHWSVAKGRVYFEGEGENRRAVRMVGIQLDTTERNRAEEALRRLAQFPEQNPNPVLRVALSGALDYANVAAQSWLASMGAAPGQPLPAVVQALVERVLRDRRIIEEEFTCERGRTFWFAAVQPPGEVYVNLYGRDITERKQAEDKLFETNQRLQALMEALPVGVSFSDDPTCQRITGNAAVLAQFEVGSEDNLSASAPDPATPGRQVRVFQNGREIIDTELPLQRAVSGGCIIAPTELEVRLPSGRTWFAEGTGAPIRDRQGNVVGGVAVTVDITERKRAEERLRHTQKLESLGLMAGGVAHDFNNLLVGVIGNASLAQEMLPPDHPATELMETVVKTGEQAAHLTRQMLAYSGKGKFLLEPLDISALVRDIIELARPSIPKKVALNLDLHKNPLSIEADRGQVQQILMNLVINAGEAIGSHDGLITVSTGTQVVDDVYRRRHPDAADLPPGEYVVLEVRDNGCGVDGAIKAKIFDPFFSTKFTGRGLGLAAVAGIVRGHKGVIVVTSAPGRGSTFTVLFPPAARLAEETRDVAASAVAQGSGVVLVIDDEQVVRDLAKKALERNGYTVLVADGGLAAINIMKRHPGNIDLAVLDLSMPGMSGEETLPELRKIRPEVKVFVSSGYSESEAMTLFGCQRVSGFIQKPYTATGLAEKVRTALA